MTEETSRINKLISPAKAKTSSRLYMKDGDLQVHIPSLKEAQNLDDAGSFKSILKDYVGGVNALQHDADSQVQKLVAGETDNLHDVTLAMSEAETSFELMMEIRNKLVDAYKELSRMQS